MEWFAWAWIGMFLLIALFNQGTFAGNGIFQISQMQFEQPILMTVIVIAFAAVWVACRFLSKQFTLEFRMLYVAAAIALPLIYLISSFQGVSRYLSGYGVLTSCMLFVFFAAGAYLTDFPRIINQLPRVFLAFGYLIVFYGFLNLFGNVYLLDSLSAQDGVRISSIFQYANAYAVLLLILWVITLVEIQRSKHIAVQAAYGFMLVPILVSFLLTLSRGAIVILPVIAIVALLMFRLKQQLMIILYSVIGMGLSLLIYTKLADRGIEIVKLIGQALDQKQQPTTVSLFNSESLAVWGLLIGVSLIMCGVTYVIQKYLEPKLDAKLGSVPASRGLIVPLGLIAVFVLGALAIASDWITRFLPAVIRTRVEDINWNTHSVYERLTMYKDALKIWRIHPIIGGGGGAWDALYEQYQSYSYTSNQTHSFLVRYLIEVGTVGILLHLALFIAVIVSFVRYYRRADEGQRNRYVFYFVTPVTILLHASIDFEMSYTLYGGLVFLSLGIMAGVQRQELGSWTKQKLKSIRYTGAAVLGMLAVVLLIVSIIKLSVNQHFHQAMKEASNSQANFQVIDGELRQAHAIDKKHPIILIQLASWNYKAYEQTQDKQYLDLATRYATLLQKYEPRYRSVAEMNYVTQVALGHRDQALGIMEQAIEQRPFTVSYFDQTIKDLQSDWESLQQSQQSTKKEELEQQILHYYDKMKQLDEVMNDLPDTVIPSKEFALSNVARLAAGKVEFDKHQYDQAAEILQSGIKEDFSVDADRDVAAYYVAALRKQGKDDLDLYQKLIQSEPSMEQKVDQLTSS